LDTFKDVEVRDSLEIPLDPKKFGRTKTIKEEDEEDERGRTESVASARSVGSVQITKQFLRRTTFLDSHVS